MAFALGIVIAIVALAAAAFAAFLGVEIDLGIPLSQSPIIYGWGSGLVALLIAAVISRANRKARFDTVIAAEVIVVYGITTLVLSIGLGVSRTADVWAAASGPPPLDELAPAMRVFAEGFVAAGISPFCAVGLRQFDVLARGSDGGPIGGASDELASLRDSLSAAVVATNAFASSMRQMSDGVRDTAGTFVSALNAVNDGGERARSGLEGVGDAAKLSSTQIKPAVDQLTKLGLAAAEGAVLLEGLKDIIASVEQFLPRDRSGDRNGGAS